MKMTWKKKSPNKRLAVPLTFQLPDEDDQQQHNSPSNDFEISNNNNYNNNTVNNQAHNKPNKTLDDSDPSSSNSALALNFLHQGNMLAEEGKYQEALGKWETAITLMPEIAVLHEQKAQVLLEIGDAWGALKAATRASELDPAWAEAWTTLGRAQLNFGEPDSAIESLDKALAIKPDLTEAQDDKQTALQLVKKRKQLQSSGLSEDSSRFAVCDVGERDLPGWR